MRAEEVDLLLEHVCMAFTEGFICVNRRRNIHAEAVSLHGARLVRLAPVPDQESKLFVYPRGVDGRGDDDRPVRPQPVNTLDDCEATGNVPQAMGGQREVNGCPIAQLGYVRSPFGPILAQRHRLNVYALSFACCAEKGYRAR